MVNRKRKPTGQFEKKYPFDELDVEDFFVVKLDRAAEDFRERYNRIRSSAHMYAKRNSGVKFSCSQIDNGVKVVRVL